MSPPLRVWIENLALNPGIVKDSPTRRVPQNPLPQTLDTYPGRSIKLSKNSR